VYGNPRLIVLDEPSSSLDEEGDRALMKMLELLKSGGRTLVVITHRPHLLALANYVMIMNEGATAKFGPRDEVLAGLRKANEQAMAKRTEGPAALPGANPAGLAGT
jgi:ABC-type protease/lipase transport system fused ATPase/permease subunit